MSFNATNVTGLNSNISCDHTQGNFSAQGFGLNVDTANNLGYGIGKAIRGTFDSFWNTWQKMSAPEPSAKEIAQQRNYMIYEGGLKECVRRLGPALANLQMSPNDRGALKKVEQLAVHFARYLKPAHDGNLRDLQNKLLKPLEERISATAHAQIKNALSKCMPVFFHGNNSIREKAQAERQLVHIRQSQLMQELTSQDTHEINSPYDLIEGVKSIFTSFDAGFSRLFSIFPGISAEPVGSSATPQFDEAYVIYATCNENFVSVLELAAKGKSNTPKARIEVGAFPSAIGFIQDESYAYVVNSGSNSISVIDAYSNSVIRNISLGLWAPEKIAFTPNNLYAYVTCPLNNSVVIIQTFSHTLFKTVDVGKSPSGIAITPDGQYAYVPCLDEIHVLETTNHTAVLPTIDLVGNFSWITTTPNSQRVYVANYENNSISVIDTLSRLIIGKIPLGSSKPLSIAINPNGLYAYVVCFGEKFVHLIDTKNNSVVDRLDFRLSHNPTRIGIGPHGRNAYVVAEDLLYVFNMNRSICINSSIVGCVSKAILDCVPTATRLISAPKSNMSSIIGLSCGGTVFLMLLGAGSYFIRWLKKEEGSPELDILVTNVSQGREMTFI